VQPGCPGDDAIQSIDGQVDDHGIRCPQCKPLRLPGRCVTITTIVP
jgi:hypothetical protein